MKRLGFALCATALIGAAPATVPADDATAAAECRLSKAASEKAYRALKALDTTTQSEDDGEGETLTLAPAGVKFVGFPAKTVTLVVYDGSYERVRRTDTTFAGDYAAARQKMLAAHGKTACSEEQGGAGKRSCEITLAPEGDWKHWLVLSESDGALKSSCVFS